MGSARDKPREMRHIDEKQGANAVGDLAETLEIDDPRVCRAASDNELRLVFLSQPLHLLVIDIAGVAAHAIMDGVEPFAGKVGRRAVGKVAAHVYAHAEDGVAGLQYGQENALIGLAAGMRLHIGELAVEQLLRALDGEFFRDVHHLAAAVIALARVAFRIFVGEDGPCGFEHGLRHVVLGRNQLDLVMLTEKLTIQNGRDLGIGLAERRRKELGRGGMRFVRCMLLLGHGGHRPLFAETD